MKEYFNCLILTHGTAFGVGAAIFLLTMFLVARRIIGLTVSIVFMLIALGASWAIDNKDVVRSHLDKWMPAAQGSHAEAAPQVTTPAPAQDASSQPSGSLKGKVEDQKGRVQNFLEEQTPNSEKQEKQ